MNGDGTRRTLGAVGLAALALAAALIFAACAVNPATGKYQIAMIGEQQEIELGRDADRQVVATYGLVDDDDLQAYVDRIGQRLAAASERPSLPWTFRVIDDPMVNAFALPGGFIYVTRGILAHFDSEAELAGVLGHEIGHVTARHSVNQVSKQQLAGLGLGIGSIVADRYGYGGLVQDLGGTGLGLLFLKFSRDDERQADELGMRYMLRERYDPRRLASMFRTLGRIGATSGSSIPPLLSTHPDPGNREQAAESAIARLGAPSDPWIVERDRYLERIEGLVFGENPREGYFDGNVFHHPEMAFRLTFPEGWRTQNARSAVVAGSPEQDAIVQLSLASEDSPEAASAAFFGRRGIEQGGAWTTDLASSVARDFRATTQGGELAGSIVWFRHDGRVLQMLAAARSEAWDARRDVVRAAIRSFRRETDPAVLGVEPAILRVFTLRADRTLAETVEVVGNVHAPLERLLILNGMDQDRRLPRGSKVKLPVGGRLP